MLSETEVSRGVDLQIAACEAMGARFEAEFLRRVRDDLDGPVGRLLDPWRDAGAQAVSGLGDSAALRVLAGFHELVLDGAEPELAALYPAASLATDWTRLWPVVLQVAERRGDRLTGFMRHEPQTNEVRRSMALVGGFLTVAHETGLPLRCFELGASAGLNLSWDRFGYRFGPAFWGDPASPLQLDANWTGPAPPLPVNVRVLERAGCDRRPVRLDDPAERRRLESYIWPDQPDRLTRLRVAADIALAAGVHVDTADAAEWAEVRLAPATGAATMVYHSVFWQYPPEAVRLRLQAAIEAAGARATADAPFFWLRMEPAASKPSGPMEVTLTAWPAGTERLLATTHPHGAVIRWRG